VTDREDAAVDDHQPAVEDRPVDLGIGQADGTQLTASDGAVLSSRELRDGGPSGPDGPT
jgi:hypothetical protein